MKAKKRFYALAAWIGSCLFGALVMAALQSRALMTVDTVNLENNQMPVSILLGLIFLVSVYFWYIGQQCFEFDYFAGWPMFHLIASWLCTVILGGCLLIMAKVLWGSDYLIYSLPMSAYIVPILLSFVFTGGMMINYDHYWSKE